MNSLTLYEISQTYREALDVLTDPELDLPNEVIADTLEGLQGSLEDKAIAVAQFFKNLEATAVAIKEAEQRMSQRRKAIENRVASLKTYLKDSMESCGITRIESPWFALSIAKNPLAVDITDEDSLPDEFVEIVTTRKVDKTAIKKAIEAGTEVPGAALTRGTRLAIR
jgi:acetylglutamate synthase